MKNLLFAFGITSVLAGTASAQSSVTLYGTVTGGITYANNVQTAATSKSGKPVGAALVGQLDSGTAGLNVSRWGLKGTEDLGSGLKTVFVLESPINENNGTLGLGGTLFGRQAWVGLSADRYGTFTLGRQGDPSIEFVSPLLPIWYIGNNAFHPADYDNLNFTHRINNSIKYMSDTYRGFRFGLLYSLGGAAGDLTQNQIWSAGFRYTGAALSVAASVVNARNPNNSLYGTNANATATGNNLGFVGSATAAGFNPAIVGFASAHTQQTIAVATTYVVGSAIFGVAYSTAQFRGLGSVASLNPKNYGGSTNLRTVGASFRYQFTPFFRMATSFDHTAGGSAGGNAGAKYEQVNLAGVYSLSKRTELYITSSLQHASGVDSLGRAAVAQIGYLTPSATNKQISVAAGIKYLF
ncbi:porin [Paraburkholderia phytofirmans OLGA172]|uniref:Porin n=1 Tax=Paraburkholderia phytofirmans OLGA172 TaxID=1417228 RepID=A0A160FR54_9BURK|nr:porin [Paraburkholderia phytofirmans]ANB74988.1 porin [Paraburkholderia phytofirmans OLGA172]